MEKRKAARKQGRKAWLVTWENAGGYAQPERRVAAVFKPQLAGQRVRELVEFLHTSMECRPSEQLEITFGQRSNPYPATFGTLQGVPWQGEVVCGLNPFLFARLVDDLVIPTDGEPSWRERPRPSNEVQGR